MCNRYLAHYGIKGQKWGVRRYQNYNGSHTPEGRERERLRKQRERQSKRTKDVNDIVRTLSKKERRFIGAEDGKDWIDPKHEKETLENKAKTFVTKEGDVPVSFVEIWTNGGSTGQIAVATRNDPNYREKGYASKDVERAIKWTDRYGKDKIDQLEWIAERDNVASINLAKKYGFVEDSEPHDWSNEYAYLYRKTKQ